MILLFPLEIVQMPVIEHVVALFLLLHYGRSSSGLPFDDCLVVAPDV